MAIPLTLYLIPRYEEMITGLWCPTCFLPSGFQLMFDRLTEDGITLDYMRMNQCENCGRGLLEERAP